GARNVRDHSGIGLDIAIPGAAGIVDSPRITQQLAMPDAAIPYDRVIAPHVAVPYCGFSVHHQAGIADHVAVPVAAAAIKDPCCVAVDVTEPVADLAFIGAVVVDDMAGIAEDIAPPCAAGIGNAARPAIGV